MADRARQPNELLRRARGGLSQATLAEMVNVEIYRVTGKISAITSKSISDWECGWYTWPSAEVRQALCRILGKSSSADLGFYYQRNTSAPAMPEPISLLDLQLGKTPSAGSTVRLPGGRS